MSNSPLWASDRLGELAGVKLQIAADRKIGMNRRDDLGDVGDVARPDCFGGRMRSLFQTEVLELLSVQARERQVRPHARRRAVSELNLEVSAGSRRRASCALLYTSGNIVQVLAAGHSVVDLVIGKILVVPG